MTPLNYAALAERGLSILSQEHAAKRRMTDSRGVAAIVDIMKTAVHFQLPEGGRIFDDDLRGIRDQNFRLELPFQAITVSFHLPEGMHRLREDGTKTVIATRRCVLAWEHEEKVHMISMYEISGMWMVSAVGIRFDKDKWEPSTFEILENDKVLSDSMGSAAPRFSGCVFIAQPSFLKMYVKALGEEEGMRMAMDDNGDIESVFELVEALSCSNVSHEPIQKVKPSVNERRVRDGKLPLHEIHSLVLHVPQRKASRRGEPTGTHASPHEHLRRGHIRRLQDGKRIMVASTVVNPGVGAPKKKSYTIVKR